jgi:hypothetical protein
MSNPQSKVAKLADDKRHYQVLKALGTDPNVIYLKKVEE